MSSYISFGSINDQGGIRGSAYKSRTYHKIVEGGRDVDKVGLINWAIGARFLKIHGNGQNVKILIAASSFPFVGYSWPESRISIEKQEIGS